MPVESAELHLDDPVLGAVVLDAVMAGPDDGIPVLLHGWPQTCRGGRSSRRSRRRAARSWRSTSAATRRRRAPVDVSAYALPHLVHDAVGMIESLGWESAHVVGHDWGAVVAWALAAQRPELVRTLTAVLACRTRRRSTRR